MISLTKTVPIALPLFALMIGMVAILLAIFIICRYDLKSKSATRTTQNKK